MSMNTPVRTCAACRTRRSQVVLVRVVRNKDGQACIDASPHRSDGRGAYLCADRRCVDLAEKRHALQRALRGAHVSEDLYAALRDIITQRTI